MNMSVGNLEDYIFSNYGVKVVIRETVFTSLGDVDLSVFDSLEPFSRLDNINVGKFLSMILSILSKSYKNNTIPDVDIVCGNGSSVIHPHAMLSTIQDTYIRVPLVTDSDKEEELQDIPEEEITEQNTYACINISNILDTCNFIIENANNFDVHVNTHYARMRSIKWQYNRLSLSDKKLIENKLRKTRNVMLKSGRFNENSIKGRFSQLGVKI